MTRLLLTLLLVILSLSDSGLSAQALNCRVEVNTSQLEGTNKSVFETLQSAINEYVNTTRWTNAQFSPNERIECTLFFNITKYDEAEGRMEGTLQVQAIPISTALPPLCSRPSHRARPAGNSLRIPRIVLPCSVRSQTPRHAR